MIVGMNFTKLVGEKTGNPTGKININNNVSIKRVEEADISLGKDKKGVMKIIFEFTAKYLPNVGSMTFEGELLFMGDPKINKELITLWKKDKKLPKELMNKLLNSILSKCNIKALILSQELNLPSPIPLPKVQIDPAKNK
jgi:hypothetical protein